MPEWRQLIGQFVRESNASEREADGEAAELTKSAHYSYDQKEDIALNIQPKTYQSYDQAEDNSISTLAENEVKDSYDTIDTDSEEGRFQKKLRAENSEQEDEEPITKKIVIELIICILAFVGRGLCLNSVGPTLIDLRQIAHFTVPQAAWIFVSQSTGFLIGSLLAKRILQEINNEFALSMCLFSQALFSALIPAFRSAVVMCLMFIGQGFAIGVVGIGVCATCIRIGGKKRNGMFLQAAYLGVSIGSVCGPFIARPFLSNLAKQEINHQGEQPRLVNTHLYGNKANFELTSTTPQLLPENSLHANLSIDNTSSAVPPETELFTKTHVHFYYVIIGLVLCVPASSFLALYYQSGSSVRNTKIDSSHSESLSLQDCTAPLLTAIILIFIQCLLYFGIQDTYSNLLTTFAILGPPNFTKTQGVYLSSLFWASMCFGRLNGIWIAKLISPFKLLLIDMIVGGIAAATLLFFSSRSSGVLWTFTVLLGLSFATINGATVSWAAKHLPGNNYILAIIMVGRCCGLLVLPTTVTTLFRTTGPITLMYALFFVVCAMTAALTLAHSISLKFGVDGKLHSKSEMRKLKKETEDGASI